MKNKAIDARTHPFVATDQILPDANFWLYLYGPPSASRNWAVPAYSAIYVKLLQAKANIHLDVLVLGEFVNRYARMEAGRLSPGVDFKTFRRGATFPPIAKTIAQEATNILNICKRIDHHFAEWNALDLLKDYAGGKSDLNDQLLVESCRKHGLSLLTNDADFIEGGLTVYTANNRLLTACPP
jgi:predicted nucleic acid-binding protein